MPFDRVVRPFGYYDKKLHSTQFDTKVQIQAFVKAGIRQKNIAHEIGVHPSTVSRELSRNIAKRGRTSGVYIATNAQRRTDQRHQLKPKLVKFSSFMKEQAIKWLTNEKWGPEIISILLPKIQTRGLVNIFY